MFIYLKKMHFKITLYIAIIALLIFYPALVKALAGTHSFAVSTWDTTRSTVSLSYHHGFILDGGYINMAGYNANFTSTTGKLSSQFGLNYIGIKPPEIDKLLNGVSGSAVAVYGIPIGKRYENGMPKVSFNLFLGSVPTLLFSGEYNYATIPINAGLGIEFNPLKALSIVAWFEIAPSFNLDTEIHYDNLQKYLESVTEDDLEIIYNPDGTVKSVKVKDYVIDEMLSESLQLQFSFAFRMRGGLQLVFNLGDRVDLQFEGSIAQVGANFDSKSTIFAGGSFIFAWDDTPSRILSAKKKLENIPCSSIIKRAETCPAYKKMQKQQKNRSKNQCVPKQPQIKQVQTVKPQNLKKPKSPKGVGIPASAKINSKPLSPKQVPLRQSTTKPVNKKSPTFKLPSLNQPLSN